MRAQRIIDGLTILRDCRVPMRDGVQLAADVFLPPGGDAAPALIVRTPYDRQAAMTQAYAPASWYASRGFAVVLQDVRGCWQSEGTFYPFASERTDGIDTVTWAAEQSWCTGAVGMYGFSYGGATQLLSAARAPTALRALAPSMTGSNYCDGWVYRGGALQLAFVLSWTAGLGRDQAMRAGDSTAADGFSELLEQPSRLYSRLPVEYAIPVELGHYVPYLKDWLDHPTYDDYWKQWSPQEQYQEIRAPGLHIAGWYDIFLEGTIANFSALQAVGHAPQSLVIGPWHHMPWSRFVGESDFGSHAYSRIDELQLQFFRRWLIEGGGSDAVFDTAPVQLFVMGLNQWRAESAWPPAGAKTHNYYLTSGGRANSLNGDGYLLRTRPPADLQPDSFHSNPREPVPSLGGRSCCFASMAPMGPADQRPQEVRNDVLIYDSDVLDHGLLVIGTPVLRVFVAGNVAETQLVARLVDVHPDGCAINVCDGIAVVTIPEGTGPSALRIPLSPTAMQFAAGHRIRLEIAGSSFPCYSRHSNTRSGSRQASLSDMVAATVWVFHDAARRSELELPVLDDRVRAE